MPNASRPRRLLALATDSVPARGYLAVVAASVGAMFLFPESPVATSPLVLTAPLSLLGVVLPFGPGAEGGGAAEALATGFWVGWLLLCALVNAAVLGALAARSPERPRLRGIRALLAPAVDNWLARGYLAVVAVAVGFFLCADYVLLDPGFAGIWPLMTTAPLSILALLVPTPAEYSSLTWLNSLIFATGTSLAGLFNAALLGRLAHNLRTREPRETA
ncbi:hypothetical protein OG562_28840 [Streptomyces sp. NBC_01275]|uniref:SCO4225 family membrane protein n=1 Tax=Streptomyces sp. NBC_01275 TaxID=2903807 RepID=UPI002250496D|nr:hypothetical protein [Streptomyces sp. NBC_01275]MCX4764906.1 hypothetical protein [Streptomyces sp. NBC_01275]